MGHKLFKNSMTFVGATPWHNLGKPVPPTVSAAEMISAANLDWTVSKRPAPGGKKYLLLRSKMGPEPEDAALGLVGSGYTPLQNRDAFKFFEPLIESKWAQFHTAGALGNGERVWVMVRLSDDIVMAKDDVVQRFILLANSHDGKGAVTIRFTPIRVVCQNTLNYAMKESTGVLSVAHTWNIHANLAKKQAETLQEVISKVFKDAESLFGLMVALKMNAGQIDEFLERLFPRTKPQSAKRQEPERWQRIKTILDDSNVTPPTTRSTLWGLYNAVVRDEDYRVSREAGPENRLDRVWFGSGHDLKRAALDAARQHLRTAA